MTDHEPRLWPHDDAIRRVGEGFLACTLPKPEWTHEAHIVDHRAGSSSSAPDILPERDLPDLIRRYNESVGGVNSDTRGLSRDDHAGVHPDAAAEPGERRRGRALCARVNAVLLAPEGRRDWPLRFYSRERLFSKEARLGWVEPDLAPLPIADR